MKVKRELLDPIRDEVMQAIKVIAMRHGLSVEQKGGITYDSDRFNIKFTFSNEDVDLKRIDFEQKCWKYNLSAKHYRLTFNDENDKVIVITGVNTRAPKYPIQYTANGKQTKCGSDYMRAMLTRAGL